MDHNNFRLFIFWIFTYICSFCKIKNNKIVVCSFYGKGYSDNPKYIVEELLNRNLNWTLCGY